MPGQTLAVLRLNPRAVRLIDWIQDSIIERNRRIRHNNAVYSDPNGRITLHWLWTQIRKIAVAGESWFVVSLVGAFAVVQPHILEADKTMDFG